MPNEKRVLLCDCADGENMLEAYLTDAGCDGRAEWGLHVVGYDLQTTSVIEWGLCDTVGEAAREMAEMLRKWADGIVGSVNA